MKKLILSSIIAIALLFASACTNSAATSPNTITNAKLTDKEKVFLSLGSSQYFAFDYDVDNTYDSVDIWIDRYEYGKQVPGSGIISTPVVPGEKGMLVAMVKEKGQGISDWTTSIITGSSVSTGNSTQTFSLKENSAVSSCTTINPSVIKIEDRAILLAGICYTAGGGSISSLSNDFFNDPEQHLADISGIDLVYIIKCRFSKAVDANLSFYLIDATENGDEVDSNSNRLLFTDNDIKEYDWKYHEITFTEEYLKAKNESPREDDDKNIDPILTGGSRFFGTSQYDKFAVMINENVIYEGSFMQSPASSYLPSGYILADTDNGVRIDFMKMSDADTDFRTDSRIKNLLDAKKKLR